MRKDDVMMGKKEAISVVQEDFSKEVTSELRSEFLVGATDPQALNTPGRGDKNKNPALLLFHRRNRKDIFTEKEWK